MACMECPVTVVDRKDGSEGQRDREAGKRKRGQEEALKGRLPLFMGGARSSCHGVDPFQAQVHCLYQGAPASNYTQK